MSGNSTYKCIKCGEPLTSLDTEDTGGLRCNKCFSRIFYKERPSIPKKLKTD